MRTICADASRLCLPSALAFLPVGFYRAEIVRKREKYEEENLGGYMRIFPSPDPKLQVSCQPRLPMPGRDAMQSSVQPSIGTVLSDAECTI